MKHHHFTNATRPIWLSLLIAPVGVLYIIAILVIAAITLVFELCRNAGWLGSLLFVIGGGIVAFAARLAWVNRHNL